MYPWKYTVGNFTLGRPVTHKNRFPLGKGNLHVGKSPSVTAPNDHNAPQHKMYSKTNGNIVCVIVTPGNKSQ